MQAAPLILRYKIKGASACTVHTGPNSTVQHALSLCDRDLGRWDTHVRMHAPAASYQCKEAISMSSLWYYRRVCCGRPAVKRARRSSVLARWTACRPAGPGRENKRRHLDCTWEFRIGGRPAADRSRRQMDWSIRRIWFIGIFLSIYLFYSIFLILRQKRFF
jgi:hypothetical protein